MRLSFILKMALLLLIVLLSECLDCCDSVLPAYIPALRENQDAHRNVLVREYFLLGLNNAEILSFLVLVHGIRIGLRQLKRVLRALGLRRRGIQSNAQEIIDAVEFELRGSGASVGYRQMHQRLTKDHGLFVNRETVRNIVKELDPEGVAYRSRRKLRRRKYSTKGPNYIWHIDGYDKLKPFGFCIHGAIDGFSRRILWLDVGSTNNNPRVVAKYFVDCVHQLGGLPRIVRADAGTENVNVAAIQRFLRRDGHDHFAGEKSFMYGRSTSNQRIEAWWSFLRKTNTNWWINFFKDIRDSGDYCDEDPIHVECLKFCFTSLLQGELRQVVENWNLHKIRPSQNQDSFPGRPDVLYFLPELSGVQDYKVICNREDLDVAEEMCCQGQQDVSDEFSELAQMIMEDEGLVPPQEAEEAKFLYKELIRRIENI